MRVCGCLFLLLCAGCYLSSLDSNLTTPVAQPTVATLLALDAADVMRGICFEAALDAAGQVFVLRDAEEHIRFYGLADNSRLCPRPVERVPFDFSGGRVLVGLWSAGTGCTAEYKIEAMSRDDAAQTITIRVKFIIEGDCPYDLVRPFWRSLDGVGDYEIAIQMME